MCITKGFTQVRLSEMPKQAIGKRIVNHREASYVSYKFKRL